MAATAASAGGLVAFAPRQTRADGVELGDLQFEAASHESVDPAVVPELHVTGEFEYTVSSSPSSYEARLMTEGDVLDTDIGMLSSLEGHSDYSLAGVVTDADAYDAADFEARRGETVTVDVPVAVEFDVLDGDDALLATTRVEATATVEVTNAGETNVVSVSGHGTIEFVSAE